MTILEFESTQKQISSMNNFTIPHVDLSIGHYGFEVTNPNKSSITGESYPSYRLHYIINGSVTLTINSKKYKLRKNSCFYLRPDIDISYQTDSSNPATFYWVSFTGQNVFYYLQKMGFSDTCFSLYVPTKLQAKLHRAFYSNFNLSPKADSLKDIIFIENFMKIVQLLSASSNIVRPIKKAKENKNHIERALEIINTNYSNPYFSIKDIAKELFLHENYVSKLFKQQMNLTFSSYLSRFRIEMSVSLIDQGYTSINKIAHAVGFSDPLYFSKIFKKYNNCSPSEEIIKRQQNHL